MIELKDISPTGTNVGIVQSARFLHHKKGKDFEKEPYAYAVNLVLVGNPKQMLVKLPVKIGNQKGLALKEEGLRNIFAGVIFTDLKIAAYRIKNDWVYSATATDFEIVPYTEEDINNEQ